MERKKAYLVRQRRSDQGTEGIFIAPGKWTWYSCYTLELPWKNNRSSLSCIPAGTYHCKIVRTPKRGRVFLLEGVPGRFAILIHAGSWAGDIEKGWKTHSEGCLLFGKYRGTLQGQTAVLVSKLTVVDMMAVMGEEFDLEIKDLLLKGA